MRLFGRKCFAMMRSIQFEMSFFGPRRNTPTHRDGNEQESLGSTKSWSLSW